VEAIHFEQCIGGGPALFDDAVRGDVEADAIGAGLVVDEDGAVLVFANEAEELDDLCEIGLGGVGGDLDVFEAERVDFIAVA